MPQEGTHSSTANTTTATRAAPELSSTATCQTGGGGAQLLPDEDTASCSGEIDPQNQAIQIQLNPDYELEEEKKNKRESVVLIATNAQGGHNEAKTEVVESPQNRLVFRSGLVNEEDPELSGELTGFEEDCDDGDAITEDFLVKYAQSKNPVVKV